MTYYKVIHSCKMKKHTDKKTIGLYSSKELALTAIDSLKKKPGFLITPSGFKLKKIIRFRKPKSLDKTFYSEGFDVCPDDLTKNKKLDKKDELLISQCFDFLFKKYHFSFAKNDLGNAVDQNGNFFFYGPVYCYSIYNSDICISILKLVQRQEYDIYITKDFSLDQSYIRGGVSVEDEYCYNWYLFSKHLKDELLETGNLFGFKITR